jgi:hypothetical protein
VWVCMRCSCSFASASRRRRACSRNFRVASEPSGRNIPAVRFRGAPPPEGVAAIISSLMPAIVTWRYRGREGLPSQCDRIGILARFSRWLISPGWHKNSGRAARDSQGPAAFWEGAPGSKRLSGARPSAPRSFYGQGAFSNSAFSVPVPADARPGPAPGCPSKSAPFSPRPPHDAPVTRGFSRPGFVHVEQICRRSAWSPAPLRPLLLTPPTPFPYTFHKAESKFHKAETVRMPRKQGR